LFVFFNRFEEIGSSNGQYEEEYDDDDDENPLSNGIIRSTRTRKTPKEHV